MSELRAKFSNSDELRHSWNANKFADVIRKWLFSIICIFCHDIQTRFGSKTCFFASLSLARQKHFAHLMFSILIFVCTSDEMHTRSWQFLAHSVYPKKLLRMPKFSHAIAHIRSVRHLLFFSLDHNKLPMASFLSSLGYHFRREIVWVSWASGGDEVGWGGGTCWINSNRKIISKYNSTGEFFVQLAVKVVDAIESNVTEYECIAMKLNV